MSLICTNCQATIDPASVDTARRIATCGACGRVVDLQPQMAAAAAANSEPVKLPDQMTMRRSWPGQRTEGGGTLEIDRRWLRGKKHFPMLGLAACGAAGVAYLWTNEVEPRGIIIAAGVFVALFALRLFPMFVNSTKIRVTGERVEVRHGPVPSLLFRNRTVSSSELKQLFAAKWGALYEVGAELQDGSKVSLVRPLVTQEQALFVERCLEQQLGIIDQPVADALEPLASGNPAPVSTGGGAAIALVPFMLVIAVVLFASALSSSVEGSFTLKGDLGDGTFTPDACESGQLKGFFGVELTSETTPGVVVRVMKDPTRGTLVAVERGGQKPIVLTPEECTALGVSIHRTSTSINEVWAVDGNAGADCPSLAGSVTFEGCH